MRPGPLLAVFALLCALGAPAEAQVKARLLRFIQVDAEGNPLGQATDVFCPSTGCQATLAMTIEGRPETYFAGVDVVLRGIYVSLSSRTLGTQSIVNFDIGRPGPSFVATRGRERMIKVLRFIVVRDRSVRDLRGLDPERQVTEGLVYNRNRVPDFWLRVEVQDSEG